MQGVVEIVSTPLVGESCSVFLEQDLSIPSITESDEFQSR